MEKITLQNDIGEAICFNGVLEAELSTYDEQYGVLTQQKLFATDDGRQAYSVISTDGKSKERRAYLIENQGGVCRINNGLFDVTVKTDDLITVVKGLCGLDSVGKGEEFFNKVNEFLDRAGNE